MMLSCRALGRGVEASMLRRIGKLALERDHKVIMMRNTQLDWARDIVYMVHLPSGNYCTDCRNTFRSLES